MFVWKVIAKMLGHIIIKTTQRYDKILDTKIRADMENLKISLEDKS